MLGKAAMILCRRANASCFVAGTLVETPWGARRIEMLDAGDEVLSQNGRTVSTARVIIARRGLASDLVRIHFHDGTSIDATPWHRFFVLGGALVAAGELAHGQHVLGLGHTLARVSRVQFLSTGSSSTVYNLSLDRGVSYFANAKLVEVAFQAMAFRTPYHHTAQDFALI